MFENIWHQFKGLGQKKAAILMYHQVCERKSDPWEMAVTPEIFESQLRNLKKKFDVVSLPELVHCISKKKLGRHMVAITFDDGFADNYSHAVPLLEWYHLPATFYLATQPLKHRSYYWWDCLQEIIFQPKHLPFNLQLMIGNYTFTYQLRRTRCLNTRNIAEINNWRYGMTIPNERIDLYVKLWERIRPLSPEQQYKALEQLRSWAGLDYYSCRNAATMEIYQLLKVTRNSLFSIGAHTVNHTMLGAQEEETQRFEIEESKRMIESLLGKQVNAFAYPYGNYNAVTKLLLKNAKFQYAVSTESKAVTYDADLFELPRIQVKNWSADHFLFNIQQIVDA